MDSDAAGHLDRSDLIDLSNAADTIIAAVRLRLMRLSTLLAIAGGST